MYRVALNNLNLKGYDIQIGVTGETQHIDLWTDKNSGQFTDNGKSTHVNFDADRTLGELGGTGKRTISVGNYTTRNVWTNFSGKKQSMLIDYPLNKINYTSSRGPASDGRVKPDVTAPGGMIFSAVSSYSDYYRRVSANTVSPGNDKREKLLLGTNDGNIASLALCRRSHCHMVRSKSRTISRRYTTDFEKDRPPRFPYRSMSQLHLRIRENRRSRRNQRGAFTERHRQLVDRQTIQTLSRRNFIHIASG